MNSFEGMDLETTIRIALNDNDFETIFNLGESHLKKGDAEIGVPMLSGKDNLRFVSFLNKKYRTALRLLKFCANIDRSPRHPKALFMVGEMYETGKGCFVNRKKTEQYYKAAASEGYIDAYRRMGDIYKDGKYCENRLVDFIKEDLLGNSKYDGIKAKQYYLEAAKLGDYQSMFALITLEKDPIDSYKWAILGKSQSQTEEYYVENWIHHFLDDIEDDPNRDEIIEKAQTCANSFRDEYLI